MSEGYRWELNSIGVIFEVDRLRRERHELIGELGVKCNIAGARTVNGYLLIGDFNFSSVRARSERAKMLGERARSNGQIDWLGYLENFTQQVTAMERQGNPSVDLHSLQRPQPDDNFNVEGLIFPIRHPSILFGDGGAAKSYTALYIAGILAGRGFRVGLFDWELCGEDHRDRLERLFGVDMPLIAYASCDRALKLEADRLTRIVRDRKLTYAIYDSVAVACDGPPEAAEVASEYFRAVRQIGCGSLHVAHVNRSETNDQKPFGSAFWHNLARSTWFVQAADPEQTSLRLGFFNRKSNLGPLSPPASFLVSFGQMTSFQRADMSESEDLSTKLTIRQRMHDLLKRGSMTVSDIATALDENWDSVNKAAKRNSKHFIVLDGGRIGLRA